MDNKSKGKNTHLMSYFAAIDIGSNALRLAIAHKRSKGMHITYRSREPVRLGSSVFAKGKIDKPTIADLKQALLQFRNQLDNHNVHKYRAIATSAMREAENSQEVLTMLADETGIQVEVISGEEEARLVSKAISLKVDLSKGNHLLIDIGGGSIELVALVDGKTIKKDSFVLGMVRVLELQKKKKEKIEKWLPDYVQEQVASFFEDLPALDVAVGTGGNMDRFIKLKPLLSNQPGIDLSTEQMQDVYNLLAAVDYKERIKKFALKPDRADVIIPAAVATLQFLKMGGCQKILFPQVGIKDGVLQELSSPPS